MELTQVRYFLVACEHLNFTRSAEALGIAVPTLTRSIIKLEEELGGQLFRRERHVTHLTDLGRLMQTHLTIAQNATQNAIAEADRFKLAKTELRIGVFATMSASHLVKYLQVLREHNPDLNLNIWESNCSDVAQALDNGEIDIAIMSQPEYNDNLRPKKLYDEPYMVAFPSGHRFETFTSVPLSELEGEDYVKRMHCEFPSNFAKLEIAQPYKSVRQRYTTEREDWVQTMVLAGLGITLMPKYLLVLNSVNTRPVIEPSVARTISIVTRAGREHSAPVARALECAESIDWDSIKPLNAD